MVIPRAEACARSGRDFTTKIKGFESGKTREGKLTPLKSDGV